MARGSGFVHPNTPAAISYSPGQQLSLSELRHALRREECVVLPHTVGIWREAFRSFVKMEGLTGFVGDIEAEREGDGPVLPQLSAVHVATNRKRRRPQEAGAPFPPRDVAVSPSDTGVVPPSSSERGIEIVSHHKLSGERRFVYPDHDGVLSAGVVPQVVISAEEKAEIEANQNYYVAPRDMTEEERTALEELESLWKSSARSRSMQGAQHRAAVGTVVPGIEEPDEVDGEWKEDHAVNPDARARRGVLEPHLGNTHMEAGVDGSSVRNTDDTLDDALRLAGELLEFTR